MKIENELRREVKDNIARLRDMGTYRGRRHAMHLPTRGQNTRSQVCLGFIEAVYNMGWRLMCLRSQRRGSSTRSIDEVEECVLFLYDYRCMAGARGTTNKCNILADQMVYPSAKICLSSPPSTPSVSSM